MTHPQQSSPFSGGYPPPASGSPPPRISNIVKLLLACIAGITLLCLLGKVAGDRNNAVTGTSPGSGVAAPARQWVAQSCADVSDMFSHRSTLTDLQANDVWRRQYLGRWVRWTATVNSVDQGLLGGLRVQFKCSPNSLVLDGHASFDRSQATRLLGYTRGATIAFEGKLADHGRLIGISITDATVIDTSRPAQATSASEIGSADAGVQEPPPVVPIRGMVSQNAIGTPEIRIEIRNTSRKTVDAFDFEAECFDNYDEAVNNSWEFRNRTNIFRGTSQDTLRPMRGTQTRRLGTWTLNGFNNATKVIITITRVHFTDGSTWNGSARQAIDPRVHQYSPDMRQRLLAALAGSLGPDSGAQYSIVGPGGNTIHIVAADCSDRVTTSFRDQFDILRRAGFAVIECERDPEHVFRVEF